MDMTPMITDYFNPTFPNVNDAKLVELINALTLKKTIIQNDDPLQSIIDRLMADTKILVDKIRTNSVSMTEKIGTKW